MDVWKDIEPLLKNPKIGAAAAVLFGTVWKAVGAQPVEKYTFTTKWLAKRLGRDPSSILAQIKKLHTIHDLFHVRERDRWGRYQIDIYRPCPGHGTARPDAQLALPGFTEFAIIGMGAEVTPAPRDSQGSVGQGSKAPVPDGEQNRPAAFDGAAPQARRGDNPPETADPAGTLRASVILRASGNSPRPSQDRGEFPAVPASVEGVGEFPEAQQAPVSAGKQGSGNSPRSAVEGVGEFPAAKTARGIPHAQKRADTQSTTHAPASLDSSIRRISSPMVSKDQRTPMDTKDARELAALQAIEAQARARHDRHRAESERREATPVNAVAGDVVCYDALTAQRQKERLVIKLRGLVNDADCREWLFGFAADLRIVYGQSAREDAGRIAEHIDAWIQELADLREVQTRNGQTHWPRGKWFNKRICGLAAECSIDLPCARKAKRLAAAAQTTY